MQALKQLLSFASKRTLQLLTVLRSCDEWLFRTQVLKHARIFVHVLFPFNYTWGEYGSGIRANSIAIHGFRKLSEWLLS